MSCFYTQQFSVCKIAKSKGFVRECDMWVCCQGLGLAFSREFILVKATYLKTV